MLYVLTHTTEPCVLCRVGQNHIYIPYIYIYRVGQNHIYTVCVRYVWQAKHQIYGQIRCIYTVLANPIYIRRIYGIFGRKIRSYTVHVYGSGHP